MTEQKLAGYEFWRKKLNSARLLVAPMVDQSELPWRLLSRRYGAELCYTPMLHAPVFVRDERYRREALASCAEDKPLIVQFCANDPDKLLAAAKMAEDSCDAIDLNLGCPQTIAKKGHYGAFLQDEWELLQKLIGVCAKELKVPITAKIRVFESIEKTVQYAKMLEEAGCQMLTVHGRTKEQKGPQTGIASWEHIKAVKDHLKIPVFANGNIQYLSDVHRCIKETGVDGIMSAEGNLYNPALFTGQQPKCWKMAQEYLELVDQYPCPLSYVRGHVFKLFQFALQVHVDIRVELARCKSLDEVKNCTRRLRERCEEDEAKYEKDPNSFKSDLPFPYWYCQPYVRPSPKTSDSDEKDEKHLKRTLEIVLREDGEQLSRNQQKKRIRNPKKSFVSKAAKYISCCKCSNIRGSTCVHEMCRSCCRIKCRDDVVDCQNHKIYCKTKHLKRPRKGCLPDKHNVSDNDSCDQEQVGTRDAEEHLTNIKLTCDQTSVK